MPDQFEQDFAEALRSGSADTLVAHLASPEAINRFAVYRNNVVSSAIEALRAAYPAVNRLVGDVFFGQMARAYWEANPPTVRTMTLYGDAFAGFIEADPIAKDLPYLADVARHDRAWLCVHHAADHQPLAPAAVAAMNPQALPRLAPGLHQAVEILVSEWPAYDIWRGNRFDQTPPRMALEPGQYASVVWRRRGEVRHLRLSPGEYAFLDAIARRKTLEQASIDTAQADAELDPAEFFGRALAEGMLGA